MSLPIEMDTNRDTIYQLLMLKLTDSLKESEEGYINSLIESDPEVLATWQEIQADFAAPIHKEALQSFDTGEMLLSVKEEIIHRKERRMIKKKILFFTIAVLMGAGVFFLFKEFPAENKKVLSGKVVLELANGERLELPDSISGQTTDQINNTLVHNFNTAGTIIVPPGKSYRIQLADGTEVSMNSDSKMMFPFRFSDNKREISISGEAFLKVTTNPTLPFTVHTQHTTVQVLGTSFNLNSYDSGVVTVSLIEGSVKMQSGRNEALLKPGFQAAVTDKGIDTHPFDEERETAWLNNQYIFRHSRLDEMIPTLERWYNVKIVIDNQTAAGKIITGNIMRSDEIKTVLDMLKVISNVDYYYKEDIIHIK